MERSDYIILTLTAAGSRSSADGLTRDRRFGGVVARATARREVSATIDVASLSMSEATELAGSVDHQVARTMPTALVEPTASVIVETPSSAGCSWGVEVVGAGRCARTGDGLTVAILDTGVDSAHEAFVGLDVRSRDFTGTGPQDDHGHGTHCAGTVAGGTVNGYRYGVATELDRLLCGKVLGPAGGSTDAIAKGILWAREEGAQVISMSFGIDFPGAVARWCEEGLAPSAATSRALTGYMEHVELFDALAHVAGSALTAGAPSLLIAAAGNESARSAPQPYTIDAAPPAASSDFIAVGALGRDREDSLYLADFSNSGAQIAAPGVEILSAWPGGRYARLSGTSMATPHVAGVAALWAQELRELDGQIGPEILRTRVLGSAVRCPGLTVSDVGVGLVQAPPLGEGR